MKKLVYLFPAVIALGFAGCTDDPTGAADTGADTEDGTTDATDPTVTDTAITSTTTGPIDPDTGSDSSTTDEPAGCDEDDACTPDTVEADCGANFNCITCLCVPDGDAPLCPDGWANEGAYADCGAGEECGGGDLTVACAGGPTESSVCLFQGCEETCDCPAPQEGFEDLVTCEDAFGPGGNTDGINECFLDCGGGETCPDGMFCGGGVCYAGDEPPPNPGYGDCVNNEGCANANEGCIADNPPDPTLGFCTSGCTTADDCNPAPETGDAPVTCDDLTGDMMGNCFLECAAGQVCPDGMSCAFNSFCAWDVVPDTGYADCASQPDNVCLATETCIENNDKTNGDTEVCAAADCIEPATDCPDVPETGDAPAACQDIGGAKGDECVLDCSAAQTCPDGAVCTDDGFCSFEAPTFTFQEDFEGGVLPEGWTVQDVDGLVVAPETVFVDAAWVVSAAVDGPNFSAVSTSWYAPAGQSDDWIISPAITLAATATLSWNARATDPTPMFADGYEVYVVPSTVTEFTDFIDSGDPTAFLALNAAVEPSVTPVFEVANESPDLQWHSVDLAALGTLEVFVAYRNNSDDRNLLLVDNIWVTE